MERVSAVRITKANYPTELISEKEIAKKEEATYTTRPPEPKDEATYTTRPLPLVDPVSRPVGDSVLVDRPSGSPISIGEFVPPTGGGGGGGVVDEAIEGIKKADWIPIILIGVGAIVFIMKPFK